MFSMVQTGVVDIGYVPPAYNGGTMPLAGVHTLPGLFSQSVVGTPAFFETVTSDPILQNDFLANGMRPVWGVMTSTYNLFTRDQDVSGIDDIKGLKLKTIAGNMAESVKALGGAPVDIPSPETYQAIRTGTVDGTDTVIGFHETKLTDTEAGDRLGEGGPARALLRVTPRSLADIVYRAIATSRYRIFGRVDECTLPSPDNRALFLD